MTVEPIVPPPSPVFDLLTSLAECLCAQIAADGSPEVCFCGVIPGDSVLPAYAEEGAAWTRLVSMYPAIGVGVPDESVGNCRGSLGFDLEIGIIRCTEVGTAEEMPSASDLLAATDQQVKDAMTMWRAVMCCPALSSKDYRIGGYDPAGPMGGMLGGAFTIQAIV